MLRALSLLLSLLATAGSGQLCASDLNGRIQEILRSSSGRVSVFAKNLTTGQTYALRADEPVRTANTIKLPIMIACFSLAESKKLDLSEKVTLTAEEKVSGTGVVREMSDGVQLPLIDFIHLMIVVSDNTATNLVLNRIGGNAVNQKMAELGLQHTRVMRKVLGDGANLKTASGITDEGAKPENKKWGLGRSSPREMAMFLEQIYKGESISKKASDQMLEILKHQQYHDAIGRDLRDVKIASKSGSLDRLRSDVAIVYCKGGPVVIAATVEDLPEIDYTDDNKGNLLLAKVSKVLLEGLSSTQSAK